MKRRELKSILYDLEEDFGFIHYKRKYVSTKPTTDRRAADHQSSGRYYCSPTVHGLGWCTLVAARLSAMTYRLHIPTGVTRLMVEHSLIP